MKKITGELYRSKLFINKQLKLKIMQQQVQETITDKTIIHFGQYKGQRLIDIPNDYLLFLFEHQKGGKITPYLKDNIDAIRKGAMSERKKRFNGSKWRR